jgi:hypothetical protein
MIPFFGCKTSMEIDDLEQNHPQVVYQKRAMFAKPLNGCGMG